MDKLDMQGNFDNFLSELDEQNYHILEEEVDIEIQNTYFKTSRKVSKTAKKNEVMAKTVILQDEMASLDAKKELLCELATLNDVEAYRILEKNLRQFDNDELNTWSILAYNESRMILNGSLKNEQQVFISTGLGGKRGMFRYFIVLQPTEEHEKFTDFSRTFIKKELEFTLKTKQSEVEKVVEECDEYISFKVLIPFKANIQSLFSKILDNCNQLTPFVSDKFIITNVGEMDKDEIIEFINDEDWDDDSIVEDIVSLN